MPREKEPVPEDVEDQGGDLGLIPVPSQALFYDLVPQDRSLNSGSLLVG